MSSIEPRVAAHRVVPAAAVVVAQVEQVIGDLQQLLVDVSSGPADRGEQLRVLLTGLERAVNSAQAAQGSAMVAMGHEAKTRDAAAPFDPTDRHSHEEFVPDEVAALLRITVVAASHRYATAWDAQRHHPVRQAWRRGDLDERKVAVIADQLQHLPDDIADDLAAPAADYATGHTAPQTRHWLARRVIAADPAAAERRRGHALEQRRVLITPRDDGTAELWALVPSSAAQQIQRSLTALAHQCDHDGRTTDQRRADALVDVLLGQQAPAVVPLPVLIPATASSCGSPATSPATSPAELPGWGPLTPDELQELLSEAVVEPHYRPSTALATAVQLRDQTCRFPGCRRSALGTHTGTDIDHTTPWPTGPTTATNLAVLCRRHHRLKHAGGWTVTLTADGAMHWTSPTGATFTTQPPARPSDPPAPDPPPSGDRASPR